jgi:cysteine-rich repeat protein
VQAGGFEAKDSLIQVFAVADPDRGKCTNGDLCSVDAQNCLDASVCQADREYACNNLVPVGCNDDSDCTCTGFPEPLRSRICVSGLIPGDTYYALVAAKSSNPTDAGKYQLVLSSPCNADDPLPNDFCNAAEVPAGQETHSNYPLVVPFDLSGAATGTAGATFDCPGPLCASGDGGFAFTMTHDAWYDWTPACSGQAIVETCGGNNDNTPDTGLVVYQGCDCPVSIAREMACSFFISTPCFLGSRIPGLVVTAGQCYKFRLSGNLNERPAGDLTISLNCIPVCGDGVREGAEECDDGNIIPGDGCSATCTIEAGCPAGVINFTSPPHGVIDARQPFPPNAPGSPEGISSITYTGPVGSEDPACWTFCETAAAGGANSITGIVDNGGGSFTINLARVITPNAVTTLTYTDGVGASQRGEFTSHPANVNGDSASSPADIIFLIDVLNGVSVPPWGLMSTDADQSNAAGPPDILRVIDMLNGAAGYPNQLNRALPVCGVCCP